MPRKKHTPEQVINKLREAEVALAQGKTVAEASRQLGVTEQTFYRWRSEYGGLRVDRVKKLKQLESENTRLKRAITDLTLDPSPGSFVSDFVVTCLGIEPRTH